MKDDGAQRGASLATYNIELHGRKRTLSMERNRNREGDRFVLGVQRCALAFLSN